MRIINRLFALLLLTVFALAGVAQQSARNGPSAERLREHVTYLASDKLEGRRTGTAGANLAAEYIAREFSRYGLRRSIGTDLPGMSRLEADSPKRYMQEFPYVAGVGLVPHIVGTDRPRNLLVVNSPRMADQAELAVGEDWMPLGFSSHAEIQKAEYVFVGYGITAAELKYDNYSPAVKDKIAIALAGTPDGDNPHGKFARYEDVHWKAIAARNAGAKALIVIAQETNFKEDRLSRLRYDNSAGDIGLPVAVISKQAAAKLFTTSGDLANLIEAAKPQANESLPPGARTNRLLLLQKGTTLSLSIAVARQEVAATNVIGILDGSDPTLKNETIVIGAHYDHLGHGGAGSLAAREGEIHHGADDNASGTAGVLELARLFTSVPRPRRTIVFIAFSGEEEGLLGSSYYVNHPILPLADTVAMFNMDMIGRMKDNKLIIGGAGTAQAWRGAITDANASERVVVQATPNSSGEISKASASITEKDVPWITGINGRPIVSLAVEKSLDLTINEDGFGPSDHSSFYLKQIPVLFFWTGTHVDYHKPSDTAEKINYDDETRILTLVARLVRGVDTNEKRPTYTVAKTESTGRSAGFRVYLGTIPNYSDTNDGLLLDGVRDDSPAAKAGLKAGDKVVKLAGRDLRNVYDYTYALGEMKAGQEYEVEVVRAGERLKFKITPAAKR